MLKRFFFKMLLNILMIFSILLPGQNALASSSQTPGSCACIQSGDTIFVNNNLDEGDGSLRCAIEIANGMDKISFICIDIANEADSVLTVLSSLPALYDSIHIFTKVPNQKLIIDGILLESETDPGFRIRGNFVSISGLHIRNFPGNGLQALSGYNNIVINSCIIENNGRIHPAAEGAYFQYVDSLYITQNSIRGNRGSGIRLKSCSDVVFSANEITDNSGNGLFIFQCENIIIGDTCTNCGNLIHSNMLSGIFIRESHHNIQVFNNILGLNRETNMAMPNSKHGIQISKSSHVFLGNAYNENIISGNDASGISVIDSSSQIYIRNNKIGFTKFNFFGIANKLRGIEVLSSFHVVIGGDSLQNGNEIGFSPVNIFIGGQAQFVSVLQNTFFCSPLSVMIEPGSNNGITPDAGFDINSAGLITGQYEPGGIVQIYRNNPLCTTCQGTELLAFASTYPDGSWEFFLTDQYLKDGDVVTLLYTDSAGNSSAFSDCVLFDCPEGQQVTILSEGTDHLCNGDQLVLSTDFGTYHHWSTGETNPVILIDSGGWYSVEVLDVNGCSATDSIFIQGYPKPELVVFPSDSAYFCGNSGIIRAFGQGEFKWDTGVAGPVLEISVPGLYCVSLTNEFNCVTSHCILMKKGDPVLAGITVIGDSQICEGDSVTLTAYGGTDFSWSNGVSGTDRITVFEGGNYEVTVSNAHGCSDEASQKIDVFPGVVAEIDQDEFVEICPGDTLILTASGGSIYQWSTGSKSNQIKAFKTGIYEVRVSNEFGCTDNAICIISVLPAFEAKISDKEIEVCSGELIEIHIEGALLDSVVWSHGQKGKQVSFYETGYYTAQMFKFGCIKEEKIWVFVYELPVTDTIIGMDWVEPNAYAEYSVGEVREGSGYFWNINGGRVIDSSRPGWVLVEWFGMPGANICVMEQDSNGCFGMEYCRDINTITATVSDQQRDWIKVYPNPAGKTLFFKLNESHQTEKISIQIFQLSGKFIREYHYETDKGNPFYSLDISSLPAGFYQLFISDSSGSQSRIKFVSTNL